MSTALRIRKRDLFRSLFSKPTGSSSDDAADQVSLQVGVPSAPQPTTLPTSASAQNIDLSGPFLKDALEALTTDERSVIEQYAILNIDDTIRASYDAAVEKKTTCEEKKWPGSEKAEKVVLWLDKFKSVGDVAASVDPIHAGLPWAAVKMLLRAVVADSNQMTALMSGMDLVLRAAGQLRAYFAYYQRLPPSPTSEDFRKALLDLYVHSLQFLAKAIQIYSRNPIKRKWDALWVDSDLTDFEQHSDQLVGRVDKAANRCDREFDAEQWAKVEQWRSELDSSLKEINKIKDIHDSLDALQIKIDLSKLAPAREATYDSDIEERLGACLEKTRTDLLRQILAWADAPDGKKIFWLCGKAGTGKSTISRTIAHMFDEQKRLGASFFFRRDSTERSNASHFFATIVAQLADRVPSMRREIAEALDKDSFLPKSGMRKQFQTLLEGPIEALTNSKLATHRLIIVIDALDECDSTDAGTLLDLLAGLKDSDALRLHIFITCRPETPMEVKFRQINDSLQEDIILEQVQISTIRSDLHRYLEHRLAKIRQDWMARRPHEPLPKDWPTASEIEKIVDMSVPLFVFAATVCSFLNERNPRVQLQKVLDNQRPVASIQIHGEQTYLRLIYSQILEQATAHAASRGDEEDIARFRAVICSLALLRDSLSVAALARLLGLENSDVEDVLDDLSSVLDNPKDPHKPVQFLHLSFREFLVDQMSGDRAILGMNVRKAHSVIWQKCIDLLDKPGVMRYGFTNVGRPIVKRRWRIEKDMAESLSPEVAYACSHWTKHLEGSMDAVPDEGKAHKFLKKHFLHWAEAISTHHMFSLGDRLCCVHDLAKQFESHELIAFVEELLILKSIPPLGSARWPLHIYQTAMVAASKSSRLQSVCNNEAPKIWTTIVDESTPHEADGLRLRKSTERVTAVTFSPDGSLVATATDDGTVRLWSARNGTNIRTLEAPIGDPRYRPHAVFSPDGRIVAVSYKNAQVWLWDVQAGEVIHKLEGFYIPVVQMLFSHDGQFLVTGYHDSEIRIWNVRTGEREALRSVNERAGINSMALSRDGEIIAVGLLHRATDKAHSIKIWHMNTWKVIQSITVPERSVEEMVFSPDGRLLATWDYNKSLRFWDLSTGEMVQQIRDVWPADRFSFSEDGGFFYHGNTIYTVEADCKIQCSGKDMTRLGIESGWACYRGEDLLCVGIDDSPPHTKAAVHGRTLVYEIYDGEIIILRLVDDF